MVLYTKHDLVVNCKKVTMKIDWIKIVSVKYSFLWFCVTVFLLSCECSFIPSIDSCFPRKKIQRLLVKFFIYKSSCTPSRNIAFTTSGSHRKGRCAVRNERLHFSWEREKGRESLLYDSSLRGFSIFKYASRLRWFRTSDRACLDSASFSLFHGRGVSSLCATKKRQHLRETVWQVSIGNQWLNIVPNLDKTWSRRDAAITNSQFWECTQ